MLTDNGWNTDDAQSGDIYTQESTAGRYTLYRYNGQEWVQVAVLSHGDTASLVTAMQYLGTTASQRNYYRPNEILEIDTADMLTEAERDPDNFTDA